MTVEKISCKTVLTSETTLYQCFFNPLFLLGSFRYKNIKISQVILGNTYTYLRNIDF